MTNITHITEIFNQYIQEKYEEQTVDVLGEDSFDTFVQLISNDWIETDNDIADFADFDLTGLQAMTIIKYVSGYYKETYGQNMDEGATSYLESIDNLIRHYFYVYLDENKESIRQHFIDNTIEL